LKLKQNNRQTEKKIE